MTGAALAAVRRRKRSGSSCSTRRKLLACAGLYLFVDRIDREVRRDR